MNKEQAFAMIEQAKVRMLTDEECNELGTWAEAAKTEIVSDAGRGDLSSNSLVEWITRFTKEICQAEFFSLNFKNVSKTIMPHVVAVFELNTSKR